MKEPVKSDERHGYCSRKLTSNYQFYLFDEITNVYVLSRFLSAVLGRPAMIDTRGTDVPLPEILQCPLDRSGKSNANLTYQACLSKLFDIIGEIRHQVFLFSLPLARRSDHDRVSF